MEEEAEEEEEVEKRGKNHITCRALFIDPTSEACWWWH